MFLISLIPLTKGTKFDELSYISERDFVVGNIIDIPVRKKTYKAIVTSSENAIEAKTAIKNADFNFRRIEKNTKIYETKIPKYFMEASILASDYFLKPIGSIIKKYIPEEIIEEGLNFEIKDDPKDKYENYAIQTTLNERIDIYKGIVREAFAKKESVSIILPTQFLKEQMFENLKKGIEDFTIMLERNSKKNLKKYINKIKEKHPILSVGTYDTLGLLRDDTKTIIIDEEGSRFYKDIGLPFSDTRIFAEFIAKAKKIKIIYGDMMLRVETHNRIKTGEIVEYGRLAHKIHHPVQTLIVDQKKKQEDDRPFSMISSELSEMIEYAINKNKRMFIFAGRKGLSPHTLCKDCGTVVTCDKCQNPITLHKKKQENEEYNIFICHHCGFKKSAKAICNNCGGWNLQGFGIAVDGLDEEIKKITGKTNLIIDSEKTKTENKIKEVLDIWKKKGGILIGTEMALDYIESNSASYSVISSIDSILSLPDISVSQRAMRIIMKTKLIAEECFLLQGRNVGLSIIEEAVACDISKFVRGELELRQKFQYAPFKKIIKISIEVDKETVKQETEKVMNFFKDWNPIHFPAIIKSKNGKSISNIIIKTEKSFGLESELKRKLMSLPYNIKVKVDPESLI